MENIVNVKEILERIKELKGFRTQVEVAKFLEVTKGTISNWLIRNSSDFPLLISKLPEVNLNWLLAGKGTPYHKSNYCDSNLVSGEVQILHNPKSVECLDDRSVTLYDVAAAANLKTLFANKNQYALGQIVIPNIPTCDGAIHVSGDSMYPILKSGDIIGYKEIFNFNHVIYGEMYIVAFDLDGDEYLSVKYVNSSEKKNHIKLVSFNQYHDPMDIPIEHISNMAIVKFMIRKNMMM